VSKKIMLIFLGILLMSIPVLADEFFDCEYSGPTDDAVLSFSAEHYTLNLEISYPTETEEGAIYGTCVMDGISLEDGLNQVKLDFVDLETVVINQVTLNASPVSYQFENHEIIIPVSPPLNNEEPFTVSVNYRLEGLKHFQFRPKGNERYALNAMVTNSRWFPCLHDPRDKATFTISVTVPGGKTAASNGLLQSVIQNDDRTNTFLWEESDPMATYLATINVADYTVINDDYHGMPLIYFIIPEKVDAAAVDFANDHEILDFYTSAFGPYPFDKLGLADVSLGGAMENQDMISYGTSLITGDLSNEDTFAHEISHMWWGDSVTLTGCYDVWLNEGFASYCEALWEENFYGQAAYDNVMATHKQKYFNEDANHRYSIYDPEVVWSATTYKKASWVLHMLRWVLHEEHFWSVLPDYYDRFKYSHATTEDFQSVCETYYGDSLDWFFQQWIYDQGYPEFQIAYRVIDTGQTTLQVHVKQVQQNAPPVFKMPVTISWSATGEETQSALVWIDQAEDLFTFPITWTPDTVEFDPSEKILKKVEWVEWSVSSGVELWMPGTLFTPGDTCSCRVFVTNAETDSLEMYPLFVILDVFGSYYFAPTFSEYDTYLALYPSFSTGVTEIEILPEFEWPGGETGTVSGVRWYAALTDPGITGIFGSMDMWEFGWDDLTDK
jgi:aminopeptidase N